MVVPRTLDEWTLDAIRSLVAEVRFEDRTFDFKLRLPDSRDREGQDRIVTACAAFANTGGGFLVFGVNDDRTRPVPDRMVGVDRAVQFAELFDVYPRRCTPAVTFAPIKALTLGSGNLIYVVHLPKGRMPHAAGTPQDGYRWPRRTDGGRTEFMTYDEVKSRFLAVHGQEAAVRELVAMLEELADQVWKAKYVHAPVKNVYTSKEQVEVPTKFDVDRVSQLLDQGASFAANQDTMRAVARLRSAVPPINQAIDDLRTRLAEIGDVPPTPDVTHSKYSAHVLHQEKKDEVIEAQGAAVRRFLGEIDSHVHQAAQAARQVATLLRRSLQ